MLILQQNILFVSFTKSYQASCDKPAACAPAASVVVVAVVVAAARLDAPASVA